MSSKPGIILIHGKEYKTVALRVQEFYARCLDKEIVLCIQTEIVFMDAAKVVMKAQIVDAKGGVVLATGHSEEFRAAGTINRTSAMENAETSAIGRALAAFGMAGTEFASADEVQGAIKGQAKAQPEHIAAINAYIQQGLVTPEQLTQVFGHADPSRLLLVEANRIINGVTAKKAPLMAEIEAMHPSEAGAK